MGYAWNGACYPDANSALESFKLDIPSADAAGVISFNAVPSISASGLVSWSISHRPLTGTAATVRTGTTQLQTCTESLAQWPVQSILFPALLFICFALGFRSGFRP